jgi:hypothetical protein
MTLYTVFAEEPYGEWHWILMGASLKEALEHIQECEASPYFLAYRLEKET